jgi:hypothetical protein
MKWTARDWRQMVALALLALANIPLTLIMGGALGTVYDQPRNAYALYLGLAAACLILVDLVCLGAILGRRTFKFKVGSNEISATGEDADKIMENAE